MKKLLFLLLILVNTAALGKVHRNIFTPNQDMWMPPEISFNQYFNILAGDSVAIAAGSYGACNIYRAERITFFNEGGQVTFKYFSLYNGTKDISILGNGTPGVEYGIVFSSTTNFGGLFETTGFLNFKNVKVSGSTLGIQVGHHPSKTYAAPSLNLRVENCQIENVGMEGLYIGHDALGGPFITGTILNNIINNTGNDGIQVRNGKFTITGNSLDNIGLNGIDIHSHGILFGGNSNGGFCSGNTATRVRGFGLFVNGYGEFKIENNSFQSGNSAIFTNNYAKDADLQNVGYQRFYVSGNNLNATNSKAIEVLNDPVKAPITLSFSNNVYTGDKVIQSGVTVLTDVVIQPPPPPPTKTLLWTAYKVINGKKTYYQVYSDFTWKWK